MSHPLDVLIVDDSPTARGLLEYIVGSAPDMRIVGVAQDGNDAIEQTLDLRPDIVLMDIIMPHRDGLDATREIMATQPTPIVLISASLDDRETDVAFRAMSAGALAVHRKPDGIDHPDHTAQVAVLLNKLRLMADVRVIHHRRRAAASPAASAPAPRPVIPTLSARPDIIAVVASTGGPAALTRILQGLPPDFQTPVVIVQHISAEFAPSLARWMTSVTPLTLAMAQHNAYPLPGHVYLAPGRHHLHLTSGYRFQLDPEPGLEPHVPSGDVLLESVARVYGPRAVGIVLTGIGSDGARGLRAMYDRGAFTIAQDEASSVVYGMPKAAYHAGAVRRVLPLAGIADALIQLCDEKEQDSV